jgi:hypothetical protein
MLGNQRFGRCRIQVRIAGVDLKPTLAGPTTNFRFPPKAVHPRGSETTDIEPGQPG